MISNSQMYRVTDCNRKQQVFEDFEAAMRNALDITTMDDMTIITLPSGESYTLLKRPKSPK